MFNMKTKNVIFYLLIIGETILLILLFFKVLKVQIDASSLVLLFGFIGLSLLPFADKLKVGNILEFERLKEKVEEVELTQFLGEVLQLESNSDSYYYNDAAGVHEIPDQETSKFLQSPKGVLKIKKSEFKKLKKGYDMESVKSAKLIRDKQGTVFVILNDRKFYVNSWSWIFDWGFTENHVTEVDPQIIKAYPLGK